jgi:hypothetical protein
VDVEFGARADAGPEPKVGSVVVVVVVIVVDDV